MSEQDKEIINENLNNQKTDNKVNGETSNTNTEEQTEKNKKEDSIFNLRKKASKNVKREAELEEKLIEKENQYNELNDKFLRLYSDFDNFRKRTAKEKADLFKTAAEDTIKDFLTIVDDFERGLKAIEQVEEATSHREGMELIYKKFVNILIRKGVEPIFESGIDFDTDIHEAITKFPAPSPELKNKVIDVVEKGYKLNGKVIRFAKVVIGE